MRDSFPCACSSAQYGNLVKLLGLSKDGPFFIKKSNLVVFALTEITVKI